MAASHEASKHEQTAKGNLEINKLDNEKVWNSNIILIFIVDVEQFVLLPDRIVYHMLSHAQMNKQQIA